MARTKSVFIPALAPNSFYGFPGLFLSTLEGLGSELEFEAFSMDIIGPKKLSNLIATHTYFLGPFKKFNLYEYPSTQNEESKNAFKLNYTNLYKDDEITVKSILNKSSMIGPGMKEMISFACTPMQGRGKFLPK